MVVPERLERPTLRFVVSKLKWHIQALKAHKVKAKKGLNFSIDPADQKKVRQEKLGISMLKLYP